MHESTTAFGAAGTTQASSNQETSLLDLLIVLARRRRLIVTFTLVVVVLTTGITLLIPNQYTAETVLLPPTQNSSMSSALMSQLGGGAVAALAGGSLGIKNPGDVYVSLLRTRTVEDAVIHRFGLMGRYKQKRMGDTRKKLEDHVAVALGTKDGLIRISTRDRDPNMAAELANGYVEEFKKLSADLAITEAAQRRKFFQQQLEDAKTNLANAEIAMKTTEQTTGLLQIDSQARALIESAANLRAQVVAKQVQLQGMRSFATENNPDVISAEQQLTALQQQLGKLSGSETGSSTDPVIPKGRIPEASMEYIRKYRDLKYNETIYELLAKQFETAKLDEARQGALIQVVDVAVPPERKSWPPRTAIIGLAAALSFLFSAIGCVVIEGLAQRSADAAFRQQWGSLKALFKK